MKVKPFGDNILVKKYQPDTKKQVIIVPESAAREEIYEVVDVGPGLTNQYGVTVYPLPQPGDIILLEIWPDKLTVDNTEYYFCKNHEILGYLQAE